MAAAVCEAAICRLIALTAGVAAVLLVSGCGVATFEIAPEPGMPTGSAARRAGSVALHVDPELADDSVAAGTEALFAGAGYSGVAVRYDLGPAIVQTVENTLRRRFTAVRRMASPTCPAGAVGLIDARLAKPPTVRIRWVQGMFSEGGGATVEVTLQLSAARCNGQVVWRGVVSGFGTADVLGNDQLLWNNPAVKQFQPAADTALADLAQNLDVALAKADPLGEQTAAPQTQGVPR